MSLACRAMPICRNKRTRFGYVRSLCTMNPVSIGKNAATGFNLMRMRVASETALLLEQPHFMFLAEQVSCPHSRDPRSDDRDPAHAASLSDSGTRMPRKSLATPSQFNIFNA